MEDGAQPPTGGGPPSDVPPAMQQMMEWMASQMAQQQDNLETRLSQHVNEAISQVVRPLQEQIAALNNSSGARTPGPSTLGVPEPPLLQRRRDPSLDFLRPASPHRDSNRKLMPNPKPYKGDRREYAAWAQTMRDKIDLDADKLGGNRHVWYLINSCLDKAPQRVVATFYASGGPGSNYDPEDFMAYLDRTYKERDSAARGAAALQTLRQKDTQSFASFFPEFEKKLAEAGGIEWHSSAKLAFLTNAISPRLKDGLAAVKLPSDFTQCVDEIHEIAWKFEAQSRAQGKLRARMPYTQARGAPASASRPSRDHDGDVAMVDVRKVETSREKDESNPDPKRGRANVECWNCGKKGHRQANCKKAQKKEAKARRVPAPAPTSSDSEQDSTSSDTSDLEESGKE